jgi:hypothetical protein
MNEWPEFPEQVSKPPAGYFDSLAERALSRYRRRRTRRQKLIVGIGSMLLLVSISILHLNNSSHTSQPIQETSFSENHPSETDELLSLSIPEYHRSDSPVGSLMPEISSPDKNAPPETDTSLTHEDILDFLLDENYLDV